MRSAPGTALFVVLLLAFFAIHHSRRLFPAEGPPAFFVEERPGATIVLGPGFPRPGIHQISDGIPFSDVIKLAGLQIALPLAAGNADDRPLSSGEFLDVTRNGTKVIEIRRFWLPARQRMALGIALHPDRMSPEDWESLPGIGSKLADRIMVDRQENGDFGSLEGLLRVKGIGRKRIEGWQSFFDRL